jgi:MFS family permease
MEKKTAINSALFQRDFLSVLIVVVNAFSWYFPLYLLFQSVLENFQMDSTLLLTAFGVQFAAAIGFAMIGTTLVKKFSSRDTFLAVWMFTGIIASILMGALETFNMASILLVSFILGFSLGLGFPSCLAYFGDYSTIENRGLLAGITFFVASLCILFIGLIVSFSTLLIGAMTLAVWRGIGLLLFLLTRTKKDISKEKTREISYRSVLLDRSFLLYFIPWVMFAMINFLETPIIHLAFGKENASLIQLTEFGMGGFVALLCGRFADSVGRKRVIIVGFIMLGIGYAMLGFFQGITLFWYLYIIVDGVAWGIFLPMFFLVVWSELAGNRTKEKYYLIGLVPFLIASYSLILFTPFATGVEVSAAFSLASFFLFIAVLPLLYAPETMPEKKMELRRLRKYVEAAKKTKGKQDVKG